MAFNFGTVSQYSDAASFMSPDVMIQAKAINLGANKGAFYQSCVGMNGALTQARFDVFARSKTTRNGVLSAAINATTLTIPMIASAAAGMARGTTLKIGNEIMVVNTVGATSVDVFARGVAGTTPASHASGDAFQVIGTAINDTDLKDVTSLSESSVVFNNVAQTIVQVIDYTKRAAELDRRGISPAALAAMTKQEALIRAAEDIAIASILGEVNFGVAEGTPNLTGGLLQQLSKGLVADASAAPLTETVLRGGIMMAMKNGAPNTIWVSGKNKEVINGFSSSTNSVLVDNGLSTMAGISVDAYNFNSTALMVRVDSDMPDDKIAIVDQNECRQGWVKNDVLRIEAEPARSSRESRDSVQGSFGIGVDNVGFSHALIENIG